MNIRLGFARIARATAILYAIGTIVVAGVCFNSGWENESYRATLSGRHLTSSGFGDYAVSWDSAPREGDFDYSIKVPDGRLVPVFAKNDKEAAELIGAWLKRNPPAHPFRAGLKNAAGALVWMAVIFAAFWALFRGVRWIALGFLEKAA
jgi:hypothetical protein